PATGPHSIAKKAGRLPPPNYAVVIETRLIGPGRLGEAARLGAALPAAIETAHGEAGGSPAVGDARAEIRTGLEHAARDQDGHHDGVVEDDPEAVEEPVARGAPHEEVGIGRAHA